MKKCLLFTALVLGACSSTAMAGQGFLRAELGSTDVKISDAYGKASDDSASGIFSGGYWFTPNFAIEGHLGSLYNTDLGYDEELDLVSMGVGVAGKAYMEGRKDGFFVGARVGIARMTAMVREDTYTLVDDESATAAYYGVNAGYDFNRNWGLLLSYDVRTADFSGVDVDAKTITVGGEWRF